MFGDLERKRQVEFSLDLEGLSEVGAAEALARNFQLVLIDPDAVQPEDVFDPVFAKNRQPRAAAAADVDDAPGGEQVQDDGHDTPRRRQGGIAVASVKLGRVIGQWDPRGRGDRIAASAKPRRVWGLPIPPRKGIGPTPT